MAEPIGSLRVDLATNAAQFEKDMGKAAKSVRRSTRSMNASMKRFNENVTRGIKGLTSLRAAAAVAAGGAGLFLVGKRAIEVGDNIGKTARAIGITAEALQELRFVAGRAALDAETFDKAMLGFSKRVGEARLQTGTLYTILQRMSPELLKQVQAAQDVDEAFQLIIGASAQLQNELERNALLAGAFGRRAGLEMVNMIANGADEVERLREKARQLGVVLSNEVIAKSEKAADELGDMELVMKTAATAAGLELMPALRTIANIMTDPTFLEAVRGISQGIANMIVFFAKYNKEIAAVTAGLLSMSLSMKVISDKRIVGMITALTGLATYWALNTENADEFASTIDDLTEASNALTAATGGGGGTGGLVSALESEVEAMKLANYETQLLLDAYRDAPERVQDLIDQFELDAEAKAKNVDATTQLGVAWGKAYSKGQDLKRALEEIREIHELMISPMDRYNERMERLNELLDQGKITQEQYAKAAEGAKRELQEADEDIRVRIELMEDAGRMGTDALKSIVIEGRDANEVLTDFAMRLAEAAAEALILGPILEELGGIFGDMNTPTGGGSGGGGLGGIFDIFGGGGGAPVGGGRAGGVGLPGVGGGFGGSGSLLDFIPFFSEGGNHAGGLRVVGEHGPELEATGPAKIWNAQETASMMDGGGERPTYVIDARGAQDPAATAAAVEIAIAKVRPEIVREAVDTVANEASRDVDYAQALRR